MGESPTSLVTGGAGFIGSHLVDALLERGHHVRVLDNFSSGARANLPSVDDVEVLEGDLRSYERVSAAVRGCDYVFHQGALPSVPRSVQDPLTSNEVNVGGTLNILLAARDAGVRRLMFASSSSVYGDSPGMPRTETQLCSPLAPYAVSKLAAEQYCRVAHKVYGLETVCLRYFNVFGPRQDPGSQYSAVIPKFITSILRNGPPVVHGDGEQSRDFTYVADVVAGNLLAMTAPDAAGRIMNLARGERHTLNDLVCTINEVAGTNVESAQAPPRPGDVRHSHADISLARAVLDYEPVVSLRDGVERTVRTFAQALG